MPRTRNRSAKDGSLARPPDYSVAGRNPPYWPPLRVEDDLPDLAGEGRKCTAGTQDRLNRVATNLKSNGLIGVEDEWHQDVGGYRIDSFLEGSGAEAAGLDSAHGAPYDARRP